MMHLWSCIIIGCLAVTLGKILVVQESYMTSCSTTPSSMALSSQTFLQIRVKTYQNYMNKSWKHPEEKRPSRKPIDFYGWRVFCSSSCKIQVWENWPIRTLGTSLLCLARSCGIHWNPRPTCCKYQELPSIFPENVRKETSQAINWSTKSQNFQPGRPGSVWQSLGKRTKAHQPQSMSKWKKSRQTLLVWMNFLWHFEIGGCRISSINKLNSPKVL